MLRKRSFLFLILVGLLMFGLAACTRARTSGVVLPTPTPGETGPGGETVPGATTDVMQQLEVFVTQTWMASQAQGGPATPAPVEGGAVATPAPTEGGAAEPGAAPTQPAAPEQAAPTVDPNTGAGQAPAASVPTAAPAVIVPTATPGLPNTYVLQSGEFPFCIARRFNVDPADLLRLNGLNQNSNFYPGLSLKIPQSGSAFPGERQLRDHPSTYTVRAGETIYSIACQFGDADPNAIAFANNLAAPYSISAGQTLQIP